MFHFVIKYEIYPTMMDIIDAHS